MSEPIHLISLGGGVQSVTLARMGADGTIKPRPVASIFSDTKWERRKTYAVLDELERDLPFPLYRVSKGDLRRESLRKRINQKTLKAYYSTAIPAFVKTAKGRGILKRKCTHDYKLLPLIRKQRELVGKAMLPWRRRHKKALAEIRLFQKLMRDSRKQLCPVPPFPAEAWKECQADPLAIVWIGISIDEAGRMKASTVPWAVNRYPLIELNFSRSACVRWLQGHGFTVPIKSACKGCPYHDDKHWLDMKENDPDEFADTVIFEREFQAVCADGGANEMPFLHDSLVPLDQVEFQRKSFNQPDLFNNECEGMCGV